MRRTRFDEASCSIARTTDLLGDWWTPLVLREAFHGITRFDRFQEALGIGRNVLTERLERLVRSKIFEKVPYQKRPLRYEYRLTSRGRDFFPVLATMLEWGDAHLSDKSGVPVEMRSRTTNKRLRPLLVDRNTMEPIDSRDVVFYPGPGFPASELERAIEIGRFPDDARSRRRAKTAKTGKNKRTRR